MTGYVGNIERETLKNRNFRKILFTGPHHQLVVMSLKPGEDIGKEVRSVTHSGCSRSRRCCAHTFCGIASC